jgi:acetylornithine deacetylase/succinyl-diaminopimelate desuccinylase-like protein
VARCAGDPDLEHWRHRWFTLAQRRHPHFGTSGIFVQYGEVRIHGRDERVPVKALYQGQEYLYRVMKPLAEN